MIGITCKTLEDYRERLCDSSAIVLYHEDEATTRVEKSTLLHPNEREMVGLCQLTSFNGRGYHSRGISSVEESLRERE